MGQRLKHAGDVERFAEARRDRAAEPYAMRHQAQRCDGRRRLQPRLQRWMIIGCRHEAVGNEEQVEFSALGNADAGFSYRPAAVAVECAVHTPAGNMISGAEPEYSEMHFAVFPRHAASSRSRTSMDRSAVEPLFHVNPGATSDVQLFHVVEAKLKPGASAMNPKRVGSLC